MPSSSVDRCICILFVVLCISVFCICTAVGAPSSGVVCSHCPVCSRGSRFVKTMACYLPWSSMPTVDQVVKCLDVQFATVVGQEHVLEDVKRKILHKMRFPSLPLRMHFAGDSGVGKTFLARQISLAMSLRVHSSCSNVALCDIGENMLEIEGTSYVGLDVQTTRKLIVEKVLQHLRLFPHGVILIDDIATLGPVVDQIAPLLGRSKHFPEDPKVNLDDATIIITSDFGSSGRAQHLSLQELEDLIYEETADVYKIAGVNRVPTHAFRSFEASAAERLARMTIESLPCREPSVTRVLLGDKVIGWFMRRLAEDGRLGEGNGREVMKLIQQQVDSKVSDYLAKAGVDQVLKLALTVEEEGNLILEFTPASINDLL